MPKLREGYARSMPTPAPGPDGKKGEVLAMDDDLPGFGIRKFESGKASYFVRYYYRGGQRKITLGNALAPGGLADARKRAAKILADAKNGIDAAEKRDEQRRKAKAPKVLTIAELLPPYIETRKKKLRPSSFEADRRYLRVLQGELGSKRPGEVTRVDIKAVLKQVEDFDGGKNLVSADRARAAYSTFFADLIERDLIAANPASGIKKRAPAGSRERVLSPDELRQIGKVLTNGEYGQILRLLILTGQRRDEIGDLRWSEVRDLDSPGAARIELPAERCKNKSAHTVPLSGAAVRLLRAIPRREGRDHVFGRGKGGFSGWSKSKAALDKLLPEDMPAWTVHDLRRSFATHCAELDLAPPHVIEAALNHRSGSRSGVAGVYNRSRLTEQTRRLMDAWSFRLERLAEGRDWRVPADNVEILRVPA